MTSVITFPRLPLEGIALNKKALQAKDEALLDAAFITEVTDAETQADALAKAGKLKALSRAAEASRKEVKAPVLDFGREIDKVAKGYTDEIDAEVKRIEGLLTDYERKQREIERKAREEAERKQREAEAEQRRLQEEADRARREQERLRLAAEFAEGEQRRKMQEQIAAQERETARIQAEAQAAKAVEVVMPIAAPKARGSTTREEIDFTINNPHVAYEDFPQGFELVPKRAEILKALKAGKTIRGITSETVVKVTAKVGGGK